MILVIESSSETIEIAFGYVNQLIYCSSTNEQEKYEQRDLSSLVTHGLYEIKKDAQFISEIVVNVGPGRLTSVRSGVAFANALAFGLEIPVHSLYSFELMGYEVWKKFSLPVLCTLNSTEDNAYVCLYDNSSIKLMKHGQLDSVVKEFTNGIGEFVASGEHIEMIKQLLPSTIVHDSGVASGNVSTFFELPHLNYKRESGLTELAIPITEKSREFNG